MLAQTGRGAAAVVERASCTTTGWLVRRAAALYLTLAVTLTAVAAIATNLPDAHATLPFGGRDVLGGWCRFDCEWYVNIADNGYAYTRGEQSTVAFFPGYPLLARPLARALDNTPLALMTVTWLAGLTALMLFAHWCAKRLPPSVALWSVACFALYPYGWFLYGGGYADALFLAFAIGAFVLLERDLPLLAGLVGAAAAATRPIGIAVAVGLFLVAVERRGGLPARTPVVPGGVAARLGVPARIDVRVLRRADLGVLVAPAGPVAWSAWLWVRFGDAFAYSTVQEAWDQPTGPHTWFKIGFGGQVLHGVDTGYRVGIVVQAVLTSAALVAVPLLARRLGAAYGAYALLAVFLPALATKDFQGMGRYVLGAFPLFVLSGALLDNRPRLRAPLLAAACALLALGTFGFARHWYLT